MSYANLTNFSKNELYDALLRNLTFAGGASLFLAILTADPTDAGTQTSEIAVGAYARQAIAFVAPTNGAGDNTALITFPTATADWGLCTHWAVADAVTAGNYLVYGQLRAAAIDFFGNDTDNLLYSAGHAFVNTNQVVIQESANEALPTGLTAGTLYYVVAATGETFQVALTEGGAAVAITADGHGRVGLDRRKNIQDTDTLEVALGALDFQLD